MFFGIQTFLATLGLHWLIRGTTRPFRRLGRACSQRREARLRKRIHRLEAQLARTAARNHAAPALPQAIRRLLPAAPSTPPAALPARSLRSGLL